MIHKIIHISDIHIRTYKFHDEYKKVFENFYRDAKESIKDFEYNEVRLVIVGDIVHQKITISNELMLFVAEFLNKCAEIAPVILVAGNHDLLETNKTRMDSLTPIIDLIKNPNINYLKESLCYEDENIIWCNYSIFDDNTRPPIEKAREKYSNKTFIGLFHAPINGLKTDIGYKFENTTNLTYFEGCDMVMCGDIHKRGGLLLEETKEIEESKLEKYKKMGWETDINNKIIKKKIPIMMVGSLVQQNFGESIKSHGFLLWDVENKDFTEHDVENESLYYKFKIDSIECIKNDKERLMNG